MNRKILIGLMLFITIALSAKLNQSIQKPDSLNLGSRIYLNISSGQDLAEAVIPDTLTKFAVTGIEKVIDKTKPVGLRLTIVPLDTGTYTFPAILIKPAKPIADSLKTAAFSLTIKELRSPQDSTLLDIAGTQKLKGELPYWAYYVIAALFIIILIIAVIYFIIRNRRKPETSEAIPQAPPDIRPNWQKALDALESLKAEALPEKGEFIIYHFRLSEIMKQYLEAEYKFSANEMTTKEIKHHLRKFNHISITEQRELINWLESGDRVKFAKHLPTLEECRSTLLWFAEWLKAKSIITRDEKPGDSHDA